MEIKNEDLIKEEESTKAATEVESSDLDQKIIRQVEVFEYGSNPESDIFNALPLYSTTSVTTTFPVTTS